MEQPSAETPESAGFEHVLDEELKLLATLRARKTTLTGDDAYARARSANLAGLAFSGGGIRSATFNLGIIQALARYRLLRKFDYLSTVSGGGYIGGWLSALLHRNASANDKVDENAVSEFETSLRPHPANAGSDIGDNSGFAPVEHLAVRYLRRYSNYLAPRLGMTGDVLSLLSIFLRNLTVIQLVLVSMVASVLLAAHLVGVSSLVFGMEAAWLESSSNLPNWLQFVFSYLRLYWPLAGCIALLIFAVWFTGRLMAGHAQNYENRVAASRAVHLRVLLPLMLSAWWFSATIAIQKSAVLERGQTDNPQLAWTVSVAVLYAAAWALGFGARLRAEEGNSAEVAEKAKNLLRKNYVTQLVVVVLSGGLLGYLMYAVVANLQSLSNTFNVDLWHAVGFGPPLLMLVLSFVVTLHIGAVGRAFLENDREFLARIGGLLLFYSAIWALVFGLVLYATPFVHWLAGGGFAALGAWAGGSVLGTLLARGDSSGKNKPGKSLWKELIVRIAPWLFLAGLAVIIAFLLQVVLYEALDSNDYSVPVIPQFKYAAMANLEQLEMLPWAGTAMAFLAVAAVFVFVTWRLDINLFSLHAMYCNRLSRAYLGASRAGNRKPNRFTGFDAGDDLPFSDLSRQRPIPIINTAINMTGGDDLAWQTRRAASFAFTPRWSGYETRSSQGVKLGKFRPTQDYATGLNLGTLVAVSGAAASPNMGYHSSAPVAGLLTAFNLRLGRWCGNPNPVPDSDVWKKASPSFAAKPIFAELTGSANAQADWVNLTDGGHFENLGVYELVRRRAKFIIATDASCDGDHHFDDFANMIRKCWVDFGVNIRFEDMKPMRLDPDTKICCSHFAFGLIQYPGKIEGKYEDGVIIYVKASRTGSEWPDIQQYADSHECFPHETTADQFFGEDQFEAYRHLGYKVIAYLVENLKTILGPSPVDVPVEDVVAALVADIKSGNARLRQAGSADESSISIDSLGSIKSSKDGDSTPGGEPER